MSSKLERRNQEGSVNLSKKQLFILINILFSYQGVAEQGRDIYIWEEKNHRNGSSVCIDYKLFNYSQYGPWTERSILLWLNYLVKQRQQKSAFVSLLFDFVCFARICFLSPGESDFYVTGDRQLGCWLGSWCFPRELDPSK